MGWDSEARQTVQFPRQTATPWICRKDKAWGYLLKRYHHTCMDFEQSFYRATFARSREVFLMSDLLTGGNNVYWIWQIRPYLISTKENFQVPGKIILQMSQRSPSANLVSCSYPISCLSSHYALVKLYISPCFVLHHHGLGPITCLWNRWLIFAFSNRAFPWSTKENIKQLNGYMTVNVVKKLKLLGISEPYSTICKLSPSDEKANILTNLSPNVAAR